MVQQQMSPNFNFLQKNNNISKLSGQFPFLQPSKRTMNSKCVLTKKITFSYIFDKWTVEHNYIIICFLFFGCCCNSIVILNPFILLIYLLIHPFLIMFNVRSHIIVFVFIQMNSEKAHTINVIKRSYIYF